MLGDGLRRDRERLGQVVHGGLALRQAGEDGAARGVGERGERGGEGIGGGGIFSVRLIKRSLGYSTALFGRNRGKGIDVGRIVVTEFVSLDGVIEDPGGGEDFEHGGWSFEI